MVVEKDECLVRNKKKDSETMHFENNGFFILLGLLLIISFGCVFCFIFIFSFFGLNLESEKKCAEEKSALVYQKKRKKKKTLLFGKKNKRNLLN